MEYIPFPDKKYNIIYADPPWDLKRGPDWNSNGPSKPLPYPTMSIEDIANMPVKSIAAKDAHLYLWVVNKYIRQSYDIAEAWGFSPSCMLTWCKPRHGIGIGGTFVQTSEHILFCRRGTLTAQHRVDTTWFEHQGRGFVKDGFINEPPTKTYHKWEQSESWADYCLSVATRPGDCVLDPLLGGGTMGVACIKNDRNFIGIELDPGSYATAKLRIEKITQEQCEVEYAN